MQGELIKSFLMGLGFDVDDASLAKFNKAIISASVKITALYATIQTAAAGIFYSISKMTASFEEVGYQLRLVAPAINKFLILRQAMISAYAAAGVNLTRAVQQSILFNYSIAKTKFTFEALFASVGLKFLPLLTKQMDVFRKLIYANMPKIQEQLTHFVNFVFKAFAATTELGSTIWRILSRVWDFFKQLDEATGGWSTKVIALIAAWRLLNLAFLATPLGLVLTGLLAILALWDDYSVWREGGKTLFNWAKVVPTMEAFRAFFKNLLDIIVALAGVFKDLFNDNDKKGFAKLDADLNKIAHAFTNIQKAIDAMVASWNIPIIGKLLSWKGAGGAVVDAITGNFSGAIGNIGAHIGDWIGDHLSSATSALSLAGPTQPVPVSPFSLFGGGGNQSISQETNILVQGSADAHAVGKNVASQQDRVNMNMGRNLGKRIQ